MMSKHFQRFLRKLNRYNEWKWEIYLESIEYVLLPHRFLTRKNQDCERPVLPSELERQYLYLSGQKQSVLLGD